MSTSATARSPSRVLYACESFVLGEFRLAPADRRWREPNSIGCGHHVVFPRTPVRIRHASHSAIVADPTLAVLYDPFQEYEREQLGPRGDDCAFVIPGDALLLELTGADAPDRFRFERTHIPVTANAYLAQRLACRHIDEGGPTDRLFVEEAVVRALSLTIGAPGPRPEPRDVVEDAKELLATRYSENLTLDAIAASVFVSPYHLARLFRRHTGWSIHGYREQLRLRCSLEMLREGGSSIAAIALACGYSSHAHFTHAFRRHFGLSPSRTRARGPVPLPPV